MKRWLSLEFSPEQELRYRQYFLATDIRQCTVTILILLMPIVALVYNDHRIFGQSATFYSFAALRGFLALYFIFLLIILQGVKDFKTYDSLVLVWAIVALSANLIIDFSRPSSYVLHIIIDIIYIYIIYVIVPFRFEYQVISASYFTVCETVLMLFFKDVSVRPHFFTIFFGLILSNAFALVGSRQMHSWRRREFRAREEINELAEHDWLTGIYNRRRFMELGEAELARFLRYGRSFTVIMIDLDHFKKVNDSYGHQVGDKVLKESVNVMSAGLRSVDIMGRLGGEEFAVVMPETDLDDGRAAGQRLQTAVGGLEVMTDHGDKVKITVSIGVAEAAKDDGSLDKVIRRADIAMYKAKELGRNRVEV
jgi:diguanylate cyclase (GGDEF)-like protein